MKNSSLKVFSSFLLLFLSTVSGFAQALSGTIDVGAGQTYTTLTGSTGGLFNAINNSVVTGDITVRITSDITEPGEVTLNKWASSGTGNYQIRIVPDGTTERVLSGSSVNMFNFSNVRNLVIDGSFSGTGKFLRFISTHKNASTLAFVNDCKSDTVMNCNFEGIDTAANKSSILIGTTNIAGGTGNDSITILNNIIKDNAAGYPKNLIRSVGTPTASNDNCIISGNEFINWSNEAVGLAAGTGDNWKILNNAFYQSATTNITTPIYGIRMIANSGNGHVISGNSIGGSAPDRSGTPLKITNSNFFSITGICLTSAGSILAPITISKNSISNIAMQGFGLAHLMYGIYLEAGSNAIVDSNYIGNIPSTNVTSQNVIGINMSASNVIVSNNTIKRIYCSNGYMYCRSIGIAAASSNSDSRYIINNNVIDSILGITRSSNSQINIGTPTGIYLEIPASSTGNRISYNKISNIFNTTHNTSPTAAGILILNTSASLNISNNKIDNVGGFSNADASSGGTNNYLYGIYNGNTGNDTIYNNTINIGSQSYYSAIVKGICGVGSGGTHAYYNNTVTITGYGSSSSSPIGGQSAAFAGGLPSMNVGGNTILRNNIFNNKRVSPGVSPNLTNNYAIISSSAILPGLKSDYNLLFSADSIMALAGNSPKNFPAWKTASNGDTNSVNAPVTFVSATDLHIDGSNANAWNVFGRGIAIPAISTDIDGDSRSTIVGTPVTIGSDEIAMPSAIPANMVMTPATLNAGTPAVFTSAGKRIAEITWTGGVVPNTITGKYYPGVQAPNATTSPNINSYFELTPDVTTGIPYTIKTYYTDAEAAGITDANLQAIKSHTPGSWIGITSANANNKDANGKYLQSIPLNDFSTFTMTGNSIPLSIDLKTISAQNIGSKNKITWSTAKEEKEDYFELESSTDGRTFKKIATIMAKGQASTYAYWDEKAALGMNYYRLKMMTASGSFVYSKTVIAEVKAATAFAMSAYPNPIINKASISIKGTIHDDAMIVITDVNGKQLKTIRTVSNAMDIDLNDLASGIYFLKYSDNLQSQTVKITKQ